MLLSIRDQKRDLQKRQNNAIRTYLLYNRQDLITLHRLYCEMELISLEQRRNIAMSSDGLIDKKGNNEKKKNRYSLIEIAI